MSKPPTTKCLIGHEIDHLHLGRCPVCGSVVFSIEPQVVEPTAQPAQANTADWEW